MCGRYAISRHPAELAKLFGAIGALPNFPPRFNAAPGQMLPIVRHSNKGERELAVAKWGLIPSWSKGPDPKFSMINARAETVDQKPAYREAFRHRRCLVPACGFFEWRPEGTRKQPYYFSPCADEIFAFAGLWETWCGGKGDVIDSFTIITTDANSRVAPVHDRMPVLLAPDDYGRWLGEEENSDRLPSDLFKPFPASAMRVWPVGSEINSTADDQASMIEPIDLESVNPGLLL